MSTNVLMPQMGESITEGTIVRWIKGVGDTVDKDEPLFEISTDKVDAEIPAPDAGVVLEILVAEGATVAVHSVVAVIGSAGEPRATSTPAAVERAVEAPVPPQPPALEDARPYTPAVPGPRTEGRGDAGFVEPSDRRRTRSSPVVRKIAGARGIDISQLTGTGIAGRVTRRDIEAVISRGGARPQSGGPPAYVPGESVRIEKMSVMRRKIAEHMVLSAHTSPHVYSAYEVDFSRVEALRVRHKAAYEAAGVRLTYTAFIAKATANALRACPFANASLDGDAIVYKNDINLGIAVALEQGLIVPVLRLADTRSVRDLCRAIQDLSNRARTKQLKVDEVQGGTFTITNPGIFGATFGLPIISQPQVAILCVGSIDKRVVVVDDAVAIRPMSYFTLGHDHRLIDGEEGARFLRTLKDGLEQFDEALL